MISLAPWADSIPNAGISIAEDFRVTDMVHWRRSWQPAAWSPSLIGTGLAEAPCALRHVAIVWSNRAAWRGRTLIGLVLFLLTPATLTASDKWRTRKARKLLDQWGREGVDVKTRAMTHSQQKMRLPADAQLLRSAVVFELAKWYLEGLTADNSHPAVGQWQAIRRPAEAAGPHWDTRCECSRGTDGCLSLRLYDGDDETHVATATEKAPGTPQGTLEILVAGEERLDLRDTPPAKKPTGVLDSMVVDLVLRRLRDPRAAIR